MILKFIDIQLLERVFFALKNIYFNLNNIARIEKISIAIKYNKKKWAFMLNAITN